MRSIKGLPLLVRFGALSLALFVVLGLVLGWQLSAIIKHRTLSNTQQVTANALNFVAKQEFSVAMTDATTTAETDAVQNSVNSLVTSHLIVGLDALITPGVLVFSNDTRFSDAVAQQPSPALTAAFQGRKGSELLDRNHATDATPHQQQLLRRYGDIMRVYIPVPIHIQGTPSMMVVAEAYVPLRPIEDQIASDTRRMDLLLAGGLLVLYLALFRVVAAASRRLRRQSEQNKHIALHDSLTSLPNRTLLRDRTEQAIAASRRSGRYVALMLLDLDRFKEINDTLGHHHGDRLLTEVGQRLQQVLRDSDTVARLGGDEFGVLIPDLPSPGAAQDVGEKILIALDQPFPVDGVNLTVGASLGIAHAPEHGNCFDELLQHADVAMYAAKAAHTGVSTYAAGTDAYSRSRLTLLGELRAAIDDPEQLVLYFQPKAVTSDLTITGVEALVRWQHPEQGTLSPAVFIPLAEHTGLIKPLTVQVLSLALQQSAAWLRQGDSVPIAVNVSARCLLDLGFPTRVDELLTIHNVPAQLLELEITESAIMSDPDRALEVLTALADMGVSLSIDDFGTGYSSMAYLKRLPVHRIKIDRSFVTNMDTDASDLAIVRASVDLARNLRLGVVAEGVETEQVRAELEEMGCESFQGYLLARPCPADELQQWLSQHLPAGVDA